MMEMNSYENFPVWIVLLANAVSILLYGIGFFICYRLHWIAGILYLLFILTLEFRLIGRHCVNCYYFGKICGFGKGWFSAKLFKRGDSAEFCAKEMIWKDMIPDMLVVIIPLIIGIILLVMNFSILILTALIVMILLASTGNSFVRGSLTCKYCKQLELGCPAAKLFNQK
ncbi:MAG: hypothetical protein JXR87_02825 [Candidatus Marinimicrobia bacterium]|nr:hypothetical protein [Candidatus Neomarinimicrobiota bacterium]